MKFRNLIKIVVFPVVAFTAASFLGKLFLPKWTDDMQPISISCPAFFKEPDNTIDVLFLGSCNVYNNISPVTLWDEHNITSYDLTSSDQEVWISYYYLQEALKTQSPKVVVLDSLMLTTAFEAKEEYQQQAIDYMPLTPNKIEVALNMKVSSDQEKWTMLAPKEEKLFSGISAALPILRYHDRWNSLEREDFSYFNTDYNYIFKGFSPVFRKYVFDGDKNYMEDKNAAIEGVKEKGVLYLTKIQELCKQEGIELLLVKTPAPLSWNYARYEAIQKVAQEHNIPYIDYNFSLAEIGIEWDCDFLSHGGARLNYRGAEKFTSFLSKDIMPLLEYKESNISDDVRATWDEASDQYQSLKNFYSLSQIDNWQQYMEELKKIPRDSAVIYSVKGESTQTVSLLSSLSAACGIDNKKTGEMGIYLNGKDILEKKSEQESIQSLPSGDIVSISIANDVSKILINGNDCSKNNDGINVVVYDTQKKVVVDSFSCSTANPEQIVR